MVISLKDKMTQAFEKQVLKLECNALIGFRKHENRVMTEYDLCDVFFQFFSRNTGQKCYINFWRLIIFNTY